MEDKTVLPELGHIGVVVRDVERAAEYYTSTFGIGPFKIFDYRFENGTLYGRPASFKLKLGFARMGQVMFELIQVLEGETIYKEFLDKKGEGLHHLGFYVSDIDERLEAFARKGIGVIQGARYPGGGFAYLDTERVGGVIFELAIRRKNIP